MAYEPRAVHLTRAARPPRTLTAAVVLLGLGPPFCLAGPVRLSEERGRVLLSNGTVTYEFAPEDRYDLKAVRLGPDGEPLLLTSAQFVYHEGGQWKSEAGAAKGSPGDAGFTDYRRQVLGDEDRLALRLDGANDRLRLTKTFSLGADDAALRVTYHFEPTAPNAITNGYTTLVWLDERAKTWFRPENEVRGGQVVERIVAGPFATVTVGNQPVSMQPLTWVCCYDAALGQGLLAINGPDELLRFRAGEQGKRGFIGLVFQRFPQAHAPDSAPRELTGTFSLLPFTGKLEDVLQEALRRHGRSNRGPVFPQKASSGRRLPSARAVALWWDLPTSKVFRDEPLPQDRAETVDLWAARGECEPFQLVLRPAADLAGLRLECSTLASQGATLPAEAVTWQAEEYYTCRQALGPDGFDGDVPDALLPQGPVDCPAGLAQPLWVTVRVPRDAAPGEYRGTIRVLAAEELLATVPLRLTVWGFLLPEERSLTAFCPVWRGHLDRHYGRERTPELWEAYLDNLAAHRVGMLHPEGGPRLQWDEQGGLAQADFAPLDHGLADFFERFKLKLTILADFTLGWGHEPRDNRFGKAEEILSPLWSARCQAYAHALAEHLQAGNWRDRVVFSLFDEPAADYYPMIRDAVAVMRKADATWRFTFWGSYAPELEGTIDVWTVPASHYSPSVAAQAAARGEEVWVYNPPGYCVDATAMALRSNYWWAWREGIPAVFQWTTNAWVEWTGSTTLWDPHRNASWVLPGDNGPTNTLRFELTREGLEDFEYLALLAALVKAAQAQERRELAQEGERVLARADEITWTPAHEKVAMLHTQDQRLLHEVRLQAGRAIERLRRELAE